MGNISRWFVCYRHDSGHHSESVVRVTGDFNCQALASLKEQLAMEVAIDLKKAVDPGEITVTCIAKMGEEE